jgi:hypothetical protein
MRHAAIHPGAKDIRVQNTPVIKMRLNTSDNGSIPAF